MADILSPEQRSKNMAAIKSKDTKPEIVIRKLLFSKGYRYRNNCKSIIGKPDIFLRRYNTAIFIHGCYWHRHKNCRIAYVPKTNLEFWNKKFSDNQERDAIVQKQLKEAGIKCLIIWECVCRKMMKDDAYARQIIETAERFLHDPECLFFTIE